ncbi:hypothetical protein BSN82_16395 [Acinetobacter baylyi]|uniref:Uncharacterized protein n=2 Tax=Moraxellaceae TaxID=468 RepID=Q6FDL7_ACIAD|nr:hypothetical protein F952_00193 [Acinetobacter baylyi DSM 14961 = CIP 107474]KAF2369613.1 hypothetical protein BSL88_15090 [Acinetobacter baylyi]MAK29888.1 hypothetical protein [Acinetobacter sp.]CAG67841.1 hypothetical protein ACIAD0946 [Acinetobacter baylyi ADP1]KAF2373659.1 hypothetical protein BSL67_11970 [Acinetobacter baylyi]
MLLISGEITKFPSTGLDVQMTNQWIISRTNELVKTKKPNALKTATLINQAINQGKPINKIVVGVNEGRAVTINLGNKVIVK